jgi:uncharacterized RDD family membrane protein YckC
VVEHASDRIRGEYAGFVTRLSGFAIDAMILAATTFVVTWASVSLLSYLKIDVSHCPPLPEEFDARTWACHLALWSGIAVGAAFPAAYTVFFWSATGQTPGKAVMGVRVVRLDGRPMGLWTSMLRVLGYSLSLATLGLGFLLILGDNRRQDLADKIAGTCVVYTWDG